MNLILWIIFGALVGFLADYVDQSVTLTWIERTVVGVVGALIGGTLANLITTGTLNITSSAGFNLISIIVSVIGALITLFIWKRFIRNGVRV